MLHLGQSTNMATRRYPSRKRTTRRFKRTSPRVGVSQAVRKYVKRVTRTHKPEMKVDYMNIDEVSLSTLTGGSLLYAPYQLAVGTAFNQRVGNQVYPTGIHVKMCLNNNWTAPTWVRFVVFETGSAEAATFNVTEIFQNASASGQWDPLSGSQMKTMYYPLNRKNFRIHYDKTLRLGGSGDPSSTRLFSHLIKLRGNIEYDRSTTGATNQSRNFAIIAWVAEAPQDVGVGQTVEISGLIRGFFRDP